MASCHTHATLLGGALVSSAPTLILPRNSQNSRKLLAKDILPRISQMLTAFLGCVFAPNLCTSVQSVGVFVGGYGIPAIPTPPSANPPTEFAEFTEVSGARYSPTDFTDAHRLGGYGILPYPRHPLPILPRNSQNPQMFLAQDILPRNSQNSQKFLAQDILPQISQMPTDG